MEIVWIVVEPTLRFIEHNAPVIVLAGICASTVALTMPWKKKAYTAGWETFKPRGWRRRGRMLRKSRIDHVLNMVTNDFVSDVEQRVYNEEITRDEAGEVYRRLKQGFPIRNLFPNPEILKEKINKRLGNHVAPKLVDKNTKPRNMLEVSKRVIL